MNWDAIGAVAEMMGAIAVLVTLVYLAVQVRHSRELLERNEKIALGNAYLARLDLLLKRQEIEMRDDVMEALLKLDEKGRDALSPKESRLVRNVAINDVSHQDANLYLEELGLIENSDNRVVQRRIVSFFTWWQEMGVEPGGRVRRSYESQKEDHDGA